MGWDWSPLVDKETWTGTTWGQFIVSLVGCLVAIMGLGAAYTGYAGRDIGRLAFVALNLLSLSLIFGHPGVTAVAAPLVLLILAWHWKTGQKLAAA